MNCKCDELMELDPLHPENEYCPIHDVDNDDPELGDYEWGTRIINELDLDEIYS